MKRKEMTQEDRVLEFMREFGEITSLDAFREFGITRLSAKIFNLRKLGWQIKTDYKTEKNRYGDLVSFGVYRWE
jgi:hypothetical protein